MPNWNDLLNEYKEAGSTYDVIRRQYLKKLHEKTGRNVILYYSGWLQKPNVPSPHINDSDKNGFMTVIHKLDRSKGLDLILHTPGGETVATESIVDYLKSMFNNDIRAIVPQLAMSAGTMIACACKEIVMGKQSSLGPIDPQFSGIAAHAILQEFERAKAEMKADPTAINVWQFIINKYEPTLIGECENAMTHSNQMVREWLIENMLSNKADKETIADRIIKELGDHSATKTHGRHIPATKCKDFGLNISCMEDDQELQDAILSVHHACMHTIASTSAFKIIENQNGVAFIQSAG